MGGNREERRRFERRDVAACAPSDRRVQLVRRDGRDVSTLYGREGGGGGGLCPQRSRPVRGRASALGAAPPQEMRRRRCWRHPHLTNLRAPPPAPCSRAGASALLRSCETDRRYARGVAPGDCATQRGWASSHLDWVSALMIPPPARTPPPPLAPRAIPIDGTIGGVCGWLPPRPAEGRVAAGTITGLRSHGLSCSALPRGDDGRVCFAARRAAWSPQSWISCPGVWWSCPFAPL